MGIVNSVHILYICKNKTLCKDRKKMGNFLRFIENSGNTMFKNISMRVIVNVREIALSANSVSVRVAGRGNCLLLIGSCIL